MKEIYSMLKDYNTKQVPLSQLGRDIYRTYHSMNLKRISHKILYRKTLVPLKQRNQLKSLKKQYLTSSFAAVDRECTSIAINLVTLYNILEI